MEPAQEQGIIEESSANLPPTDVSSGFSFQKFLPFIVIGLVCVFLLGSLVVFSAGKQTAKKISPTPTIRPTATPFSPSIIPEASPTSVSTFSGNLSITPKLEKIGRLAFIREGDIYHSDLESFSLLVKNATPAADKLSWSPKGNFLSWREKNQTATPSSLAVYNRLKKEVSRFSLGREEELIDYAWEPEEKKLAIVFVKPPHSRVVFYSFLDSSWQLLSESTASGMSLRKIFWPKEESIIFLNEKGIGLMEGKSTGFSLKYLVENEKILALSLSPDKSKILYSVGDKKKSDLYLLDLKTDKSRQIPPLPAKVDMGTTNLSEKILNNGFIPFALFIPNQEKILVGYHFLEFIPLVGIYDLKENSFSAIAPFSLSPSDVMVDELRLLGERVTNFEGKPTWQISLFTLEDNAKLSLIRVIPHASSPAFFGNDILPSGNSF